MDLKKAKSNFARMKSKLGVKGKNLAPGSLLMAKGGLKKPMKKTAKSAVKSGMKKATTGPKKGFGMTAPKKGEDVYGREAKNQGLKKAKPVMKPKKRYVPGGDRTEGVIPPGR